MVMIEVVVRKASVLALSLSVARHSRLACLITRVHCNIQDGNEVLTAEPLVDKAASTAGKKFHCLSSAAATKPAAIAIRLNITCRISAQRKEGNACGTYSRHPKQLPTCTDVLQAFHVYSEGSNTSRRHWLMRACSVSEQDSHTPLDRRMFLLSRSCARTVIQARRRRSNARATKKGEAAVVISLLVQAGDKRVTLAAYHFKFSCAIY
jgi:hypothetical protein